VQKSTPAVVSVIVSKNVPQAQDFFSNPFGFPDFFGTPPGQNPGGSNGQNGSQLQQIGGGSGFFITGDGLIVTNKHVVEDTAAEYSVLTNDGKEHKATILARDPVNDIAVIKIDGTDYPTLSLGDSDGLKIGQTVIAIGNSLGEFTNTVSRGIVSGLKRSVTASGGFGQSETLTNIIQTDAAINPGNSGGPLLDINGNVIGVNVAVAQGAQNIGFALPSNQIAKVVNQVKTTGKISTPYIGVRYVPIDSAIQQENNLPYDYGVLVSRGQKITDFAVIPGSPADKAGIVENDIILEVNGTKIDSNNGLADLIAKYNVGDTVTLKIWDKGAEKTVQVTLAEKV
jgi:S1-C subfamily serine protease